MAVSLASEPELVKKDLFQTPRSDPRDLLRQRDHRLVRVERGGMAQLVDLRLLRSGDARVAVADADRDNAAEEVEVALPFHVPDVLHLAALQRQRVGEVVGNGGIDILLLLGDDFFAVHDHVLPHQPCATGPTTAITVLVPATDFDRPGVYCSSILIRR